jgi:hypothetical protein
VGQETQFRFKSQHLAWSVQRRLIPMARRAGLWAQAKRHAAARGWYFQNQHDSSTTTRKVQCRRLTAPGRLHPPGTLQRTISLSTRQSDASHHHAITRSKAGATVTCLQTACHCLWKLGFSTRVATPLVSHCCAPQTKSSGAPPPYCTLQVQEGTPPYCTLQVQEGTPPYCTL